MEILTEGLIYTFIVEKKITLPDGEYFILTYDDRKFLLPSSYYSDYKITPGKPLSCIVNKINCNGKIFLEPLHPVYSKDMLDCFEIFAIEQRTKHKTKETYCVALARNSKTQKAAVLNCENILSYSLPFKATCKVVKIKKAEVLLTFLLPDC